MPLVRRPGKTFPKVLKEGVFAKPWGDDGNVGPPPVGFSYVINNLGDYLQTKEGSYLFVNNKNVLVVNDDGEDMINDDAEIVVVKRW